MVGIIDDWKALKKHIQDHPNTLVMYRIDDLGEDARVRIIAGALGIDRIIKAKDDDLDDVVRFMEEINAVVIKKQVPNEVFFM